MGRKKKTPEKFIKQAVELYGDKYSYEEMNYVDGTTPVRIFCNTHNEYFYKTPRGHINNKVGCPLCSFRASAERRKVRTAPKLKYTTEAFILASKSMHGDKYDYSLTDYTGSRTKVALTCKKHYITFWQGAAHHLRGCEGCPVCKEEARSLDKSNRLTTDVFIERSVSVHGYRYDYSLVNYTNTLEKVKILCKKHGVFFQKPGQHMRGAGCPSCHEEARSKLCSHTTEEFIQDAITVHGNGVYDYSNVVYIHSRQPVEIICKIHNLVFMQTPNNHKAGSGCPLCASSGFKAENPANLYVLEVEGYTDFIGFGITTNKDRRLKLHTAVLASHGLSIVRTVLFSGSGEDVLRVELSLKRRLRIYNTGIAGFCTEATRQPIEDVLSICHEALAEAA